MKRIFSLAIVLCMLTLLIGCDALPANTDGEKTTTTTLTTTTTVTTTSSSAVQSSSTEQATPTGKQLTPDEAKAKALAHAAVNEADTFDWDIELDYEYGQAVYEVSFETREFEFEYEIHAYNGEVLRFEKERND